MRLTPVSKTPYIRDGVKVRIEDDESLRRGLDIFLGQMHMGDSFQSPLSEGRPKKAYTLVDNAEMCVCHNLGRDELTIRLSGMDIELAIPMDAVRAVDRAYKATMVD